MRSNEVIRVSNQNTEEELKRDNSRKATQIFVKMFLMEESRNTFHTIDVQSCPMLCVNRRGFKTK